MGRSQTGSLAPLRPDPLRPKRQTNRTVQRASFILIFSLFPALKRIQWGGDGGLGKHDMSFPV